MYHFQIAVSHVNDPAKIMLSEFVADKGDSTLLDLWINKLNALREEYASRTGESPAAEVTPNDLSVTELERMFKLGGN